MYSSFSKQLSSSPSWGLISSPDEICACLAADLFSALSVLSCIIFSSFTTLPGAQSLGKVSLGATGNISDRNIFRYSLSKSPFLALLLRGGDGQEYGDEHGDPSLSVTLTLSSDLFLFFCFLIGQSSGHLFFHLLCFSQADPLGAFFAGNFRVIGAGKKPGA